MSAWYSLLANKCRPSCSKQNEPPCHKVRVQGSELRHKVRVQGSELRHKVRVQGSEPPCHKVRVQGSELRHKVGVQWKIQSAYDSSQEL